MKSEDITLGTIFVFAVVISGLLAGNLQQRQEAIAPSRQLVSKVPLGGFQKFTSSIYFMLFLNHLGNHEITAESVPDISRRIHRIIHLDPDFGRVYYEGALMLAPVAPEEAIKILELGMAHPNLKAYWKLPMLAGLIIMRPERMSYLQGGAMDEVAVVRARGYFDAAVKCPGGAGAKGNLHFADAYLKWLKEKPVDQESNPRPLLAYELEIWLNEWDQMHQMYDGLMDMGYANDSTTLTDAMISSSGNDKWRSSGLPFEIDTKILHLLRKIQANPQGLAEGELEDLTTQVLERVFPSTRFDLSDLTPLSIESSHAWEGSIAAPAERPYVVALSVPWDCRVLNLTAITAAGSADCAVQIDGQPVDGLAMQASSEKKTATATGNHHVKEGQTLTIQVANPADAADLSYSLRIYR